MSFSYKILINALWIIYWNVVKINPLKIPNSDEWWSRKRSKFYNVIANYTEKKNPKNFALKIILESFSLLFLLGKMKLMVELLDSREKKKKIDSSSLINGRSFPNVSQPQYFHQLHGPVNYINFQISSSLIFTYLPILLE